MVVAVMTPQDCLQKRQLISSANKPRRNPNPNPNPKRSSRRRRNSTPPPPPPAGGPIKAQIQPRPKSAPAMGQVRILKRGDDLSAKPAEPACCEPGTKPVGFYAGSAFVTSPPPSSVPMPAFFTARRNCGMNEADIASGLRHLLKMQ